MADLNNSGQSWGNQVVDDMFFSNFNSQNTQNTQNAQNAQSQSNPLNPQPEQLLNDSNFLPNFSDNSNTPQPNTQNQSQLHQKQQQQLFQQLQLQKQRQQQHQQTFQFQSGNDAVISPQQSQQIRSQVGSQLASQNGTPKPANLDFPQNNQQAPQQIQPQKRPQMGAQLNQQNTEKFLDLVEQYMKRLNKPFIRYPSVAGIKINLFILYYMVTCVGGFIKALQEGKFPLIATQLGIPSPTSNQALFNEFLQIYYTNLLPFEQYAKTADGIKDSQRRAMQHQQQHQQQQYQQQQQHLQHQHQQQQRVTQNSNIPLINANGQPSAEAKQHLLQQQEQLNQLQLQQRIPKNQQKTKLKTISQQQEQNLQKQNFQSQISPQIPMQQSNQIPEQLQQFPNQVISSQVVAQTQANKIVKPPVKNAKLKKLPGVLSNTSNISDNPIVSNNPSVIKNYIPHTIIQDKPGGIDILNIERLGEELDDMKPVFLYFPELGKVDIKALALSLSSGIVAEINVALNVLLIITSDPNIQIPLENSMILLDSLASLGKTIVEKLDSSSSCFSEYKKEKVFDPSSQHKANTRIDEIFEKYSKNYGDAEYTIEVDSFTSQLITSNKPSNETIKSGMITIGAELVIPSKPSAYARHQNSFLLDDKINSFEIPNYLDLLHECRSQADDIDFNIYGKSYFDKQTVLVEELSTISLIFRNLSFIGNNNLIFATNKNYLDFLYSLIYATFAKKDIFVFARKRLSLMKDTLIILSNIMHAIDIRNDMEAWLILVLVLSFTPVLKESERNLNLTTSKVDPTIYRYHFHSVDILSKLICGSFANRNKLNSLLLGKTSDESILKMIKMSFGENFYETGSLFKSTFSLFTSILPISKLYQGIDSFNEMFQTCIESLLSCLILVETLESSNFNSNIALEIITSEERLGMVLQHLAFVYAAVYMNVKDNTREKHAIFSSRCSELANKLINSAIDYSVSNETVVEELPNLRFISRLLGNVDNQIGLLMTMCLPSEITEQVVETLKLHRKIENLV